MLAPVLAAVTFLSAAGIVSAACQNDAVCQSLGCKDQFQVVFGNTEIVEAKTTAPVRIDEDIYRSQSSY